MDDWVQCLHRFVNLGLSVAASMQRSPLSLLAEYQRYLKAHCNHSVVSWFAEAEWR